jgi:plastocyanin
MLGVLLALLAGSAAAEEHLVTVVDNAFQPSVLTIRSGDTVRWTNQGALPHNARADDDSFRCSTSCSAPASTGAGVGAPSSGAWSSVIQFTGEGEAPYYCEVHGAPGGFGMSGRIIVEPLEEPDFAINFGLTGPWYNPSMSGQGFYVDVVPSFDPPVVAVAWFTFDTESGGQERQRWFTGLGSYQDGSDQVEMTMFRTTQGRFNLTTPPAQTETVGSATLLFENCLSATFSYSLELGSGEQPDPRSGSIALQRTTPDVLCEALANPPEEEE